jgi:glucosamine-6-phosphate deaminase
VISRQVDRLEVEVYDSPEELGEGAAAACARAIGAAVSERGEAHAMFATGNSQLAFVDAVTARSDVPWSDVVVFHMDEYVGVGPDHPAGFQRWIRERITERVNPKAVHYVDGLAEPAAACAEYAALLARFPLDICCLGIGENGHLAFNDPGVADFDDPLDVKEVELDEPCRLQQVGEGHFADLSAVPTRAITVTVPALLRATTVLAVVPEARKAIPVRQTLQGLVTPDCPASALRETSGATLFLEPASASLLGWK